MYVAGLVVTAAVIAGVFALAACAVITLLGSCRPQVRAERRRERLTRRSVAAALAARDRIGTEVPLR